MYAEGGLYGLKTSAARFYESLASKLCRLGFNPSRTDFDLWIPPMGDYYEYVATYVDVLLVFSRDPMKIIDEIKSEYDLKGVRQPEYYLGGNFHATQKIDNVSEAGSDERSHHLSEKWLKEGIRVAFSARTYIKQYLD